MRRRVTLDKSDQGLLFDTATIADLRALSLDPDAYGRRLGALLFTQPDARTALGDAITEAQTRQIPLQLRLQLGSHSALHGLRWETIRDPVRGRRLATLKEVVFSRALTEGVSFPRQLSSRGGLRAVVAIASPQNIDSYNLAPISRTEEETRARNGFAQLQLNEPAQIIRATRAEIAKAFLNEPDIVYLMAHGWLSEAENSLPQPILLIEDAQGDADPYTADDLISLVMSLNVKPGMLILSSCFSAGEAGDGLHTGSSEEEHQMLAALAPRLAEVGVPIVIGARGLLSVSSAQILLEELFVQLAREGLVDRAFAAARARLWAEQREDWWTPVLFLRQQSGRIWQTPQAEVSIGTLQHLLKAYPMLDSDDMHRIAANLGCCQSLALLPIDRYTTFDELFEVIHFFDATSDEFATLSSTLDEILPCSVSWIEVANLCKLLKTIRFDKQKINRLASVCSEDPDWLAPSDNTHNGLASLARALAALPIRQSGRISLVTLVDQLTHMFADRDDLQQLLADLHAWRVRIGTHLNFSLPNHPTQVDGDHQRTYLLIQVTQVVQGIKAPGTPLSEQEKDLLDHELFVDAWLFPESDPSGIRHQVLPSRSDRDKEPSLPNFTVRTLIDGLSTIVQDVADERPDLDLAVEILLPRELMLLDFDRWPMPWAPSRFHKKPITLGQSYPLTVRALDRFYGQYRQRLERAWRDRWAHIKGTTPIEARVCWITSRQDADVMHLRGTLVNNRQAIGVVQTVSLAELIETEPELTHDLIDVALLHGVPAMLILRGPKSDAVKAKAAIRDLLQGCLPHDLGDRVFKWRNNPDSYQVSESYCHHLTLLWDDLSRCPPAPFEQPG